jgi:hypothetical protein
VLKLAAVYRDMAATIAPDGRFTKIDADKRNDLIEKLRAMTVQAGCTEGKADTSLQMRLRLERDM